MQLLCKIVFVLSAIVLWLPIYLVIVLPYVVIVARSGKGTYGKRFLAQYRRTVTAYFKWLMVVLIPMDTG